MPTSIITFNFFWEIDSVSLIAIPISNAKFIDTVVQSILMGKRIGELKNLLFDTSYEAYLRIYFNSRNPESVSLGCCTTRAARKCFMLFYSKALWHYQHLLHHLLIIGISEPFQFHPTYIGSNSINLSCQYPQFIEGRPSTYVLSYFEKNEKKKKEKSINVLPHMTSCSLTDLHYRSEYTFNLRLLTTPAL